jgi:mannose-1-phosphate guanylyltransferase / mannose-6-phosphate isomerase
MLQGTVQRVSAPTLFGRPIIVTNDQYRFLVAEQLAAIGTEADILLEPARRDSGPAIAAGATFAAKRDENSLLVALAADHVISDPVAFVKVCRLAADADRIVAFGVRPTRPATEYATFAQAHRSATTFLRLRNSSRSPTGGPPTSM